MSLLRKLATYILSSLFIILAFTMVTSYAIGNSIQKENVKSFIKSQLGELANANEQCNDMCKDVTETTLKAICIEECLSSFSNQSEGAIDTTLDKIYNMEFYNIKISEAVSIISNFTLFFILTIIFGIAILFVSENPLVTLGKDNISISISLFVSSFIFNLIPLPEVSAVSIVYDYLSSGLKQEIYFGIIFLIIGIVFLIANYVLKRRKTTSPLSRTSQKKLSRLPSRSRK